MDDLRTNYTGLAKGDVGNHLVQPVSFTILKSKIPIWIPPFLLFGLLKFNLHVLWCWHMLESHLPEQIPRQTTELHKSIHDWTLNQNHKCNIVAFKSLTFNTMKRSVKICIFPCTDPNGVNNAVVPPPNLAIFPRDDLPPHSELQTYYSRYIVYSSGNWLAGWGSWGIDIFTLQIIDNTLTPTDHPITLQRECPNIPRTLAA